MTASISSPTTCLVTGGASYVGSHIVRLLLKDGHRVRVTGRDKTKLESLGYLQESGTGTLEYFQADLNDPGSFDQAIDGCTHVFHVASPFIMSVKPTEAEEKLVKPAVNGVANVLQAAKNTKSVKRVVMTSSIVAMCGDNFEHKKNKSDNIGYVTENDWNNVSSISDLPYSYSKTEAERKAWEIQKEDGVSWDLITIHPGFVLGPAIVPGSGESITFAKDALAGKFLGGFPHIHVACVDVRDVAKAHIAAAFQVEAHGRYMCVSDVMSLHDLLDETGRNCSPQRKLVGGVTPAWLVWLLSRVLRLIPWDNVKAGLNKPMVCDSSRCRSELFDGAQMKTPVQSLTDMVESLAASTI
jgi:nucleoside-diphosphate-sugar epimerase